MGFENEFVFNILFGKEFFLGKHKNNVFGINGRLNFVGGERFSPVLEAQSLAAKQVLFDHSSPFSSQQADMRYLDISLTYRINKASYSSIFALQVKNNFR